MINITNTSHTSLPASKNGLVRMTRHAQIPHNVLDLVNAGRGGYDTTGIDKPKPTDPDSDDEK